MPRRVDRLSIGDAISNFVRSVMPAISPFAKTSLFKKHARRAIGALAQVAWPIIPRTAYLGAKPFNLFLALTRKCNANCVFCAYQFAPKEDKSHMPDFLFERIAEQIGKIGVHSVMLSTNIGEPTIAPRFLEKVARLRRAGVASIGMTSNALYWHKIGIDELLESGPDVINISFAGFDPQMYERDYRVSHYEQTRDNILSLLRKNAALGSPKAVQLWLRGDQPIEKMIAAPEIEEVRNLGVEISAMNEVDDWLGLIKSEALPDGYRIQQEKPPLGPLPCSLLFDLTIHPDGDIHLCACRNVSNDPDLHIGNIASMSILEAFSKIPKALERWEQGAIPYSCRSCSMYNNPALGAFGRIRSALERGGVVARRHVVAPSENGASPQYGHSK